MSEKSASEGQTRQKSAKRRSLRSVNEYFEPIFNAVWPSAASFRTEPSGRLSGARGVHRAGLPDR
ncbi:hypothetical protein EQG41_08530 [Billgrantia azerbaijanica]|nr:hypothetical protein EQG41_08530 [Halomonas azerbaijanica]